MSKYKVWFSSYRDFVVEADSESEAVNKAIELLEESSHAEDYDFDECEYIEG